MTLESEAGRLKRKQRIRRKLSGTAERPRLTVFKSTKHIYAQIVNDETGSTLLYASDLEPALREELKAEKLKKSDVAAKVGALIARKCLERQIVAVVFDRNGFPYHGRVRAVAEAARKAGLEF